MNKLEKKELIILNQLNLMSNEGSPLRLILVQAANLIKNLFEFTSCGIYCLSDDKTYLILRAVSSQKDVLSKVQNIYGKIIGDKNFQAVGMKIPLYEGSTFQKVLSTGVYELVGIERGLKDFTEDLKIQSKAYLIAKVMTAKTVVRVPLMAGNSRLGVIGASRNNSFTSAEVECLADIAMQLALIIKRHVAEKKIEESELRYKQLFQNSGDSIIILDDNCIVREANKQACKTYGYSFEEMIGMNGYDLAACSSDKITKAARQKLIHNGGIAYETKHRKKDGTIFDVLVSATSIKIDSGERTQFVSKDITELKKINEYQAKEKQLDIYMKAIDLSAMPVVLCHLSDIIFVNKQMASLTGYTKDELKEMSLRDIVSRRDIKYFDENREITFNYDVGVSSTMELTIINKRGDGKYVTLNQVKTDMGNGDPIFSTTIVDKNYMSKKLKDIDILLDIANMTIEGMHCGTK